MSNRRTQRKAYFQGADQASVEGNITSNDPNKLGYGSKSGVEYSHTELNPPVGDVRDYEQKAFEGAAAETKKNLGPSGEEFDLKKHWLRIPEDAKVANAKLVAGLTRKANVKDSFWTLYIKNQDGTKTPILKASYVDLWGNKLSKKVANELGIPQHADKEIWTNKEVADAVVAKTSSQEYINNVFKSIKDTNMGFSAVAYLMTGHDGFLKRATAAGKIVKAQELDGAPAEMAPAAEAPMGDDLGAAIDAEAEETAGEADVTVELLEQKHEELETAQTNLVEQTAPEATADVFRQLQDAEKMVDEAKEELALASRSLRNKKISAAQKIKLIKLAAEAQEEAIDTLGSADSAVEKAEQAVEQADAAISAATEVAGGDAAAAPAGEEVHEEMAVEAPAADMGGEAPVATETLSIEAALSGNKAKDFVTKFLKSRADLRKKAEMGADKSYEQGKYGVKPEGAPKDGKDEINRAHPQGGTQVPDLTAGGKPENNGGRVETVTEAQDHDLKVADKMPTGELSGKPVAVASSDPRLNKLSELIKSSSADSATKEFWGKLLWGQSDEKGKEFGRDLTKDFVPGGNETGKATAAAVEEGQAKVIRAYELVDEAIDKGFCERTAEAKSKFVKEVLAFNDEAFVSFKNLVEAAPRKSDARVAVASANIPTSKLPKVGLKDDSAVEIDDLASRLSKLNWK
jgi:hypothetical protein